MRMNVIFLFLIFCCIFSGYGKDCFASEDFISVEIQPMAELDFKTKSEIYEMRRNAVRRYPALYDEPYEPDETVFSKIEDKKPWWGILGLCYYSSGEQSIAGPSEESRFILNPFLLVGLDEGNAYRINNPDLKPKAIYPVPENLVWREDRSYARVKYDICAFSMDAYGYLTKWDKEHTFLLVAYNARDLGFKYMHVIEKRSRNILSFDTATEALFIPYLLHCGSSCGYTGGCNNMSPNAPQFMIKVLELPASVYIKLWKTKPRHLRQAADMVFVIDMI